MVNMFVSYCQKDSVYAENIDLYFKDKDVNIWMFLFFVYIHWIIYRLLSKNCLVFFIIAGDDKRNIYKITGTKKNRAQLHKMLTEYGELRAWNI